MPWFGLVRCEMWEQSFLAFCISVVGITLNFSHFYVVVSEQRNSAGFVRLRACDVENASSSSKTNWSLLGLNQKKIVTMHEVRRHESNSFPSLSNESFPDHKSLEFGAFLSHSCRTRLCRWAKIRARACAYAHISYIHVFLEFFDRLTFPQKKSKSSEASK